MSVLTDTSADNATPADHLTPAALHRLALELARRTELWSPLVGFATDTRYYVRLLAAEDHEAWLLTWLPGQSTGLHDHGGSAGAFTVVQGALREDSLGPAAAGTAAQRALVRRDLTVGRARAFGPRHVHDVSNVGDVPAVSLHVYAPALEGLRRFVLDGSGRLRAVSRETAGVDW